MQSQVLLSKNPSNFLSPLLLLELKNKIQIIFINVKDIEGQHSIYLWKSTQRKHPRGCQKRQTCSQLG